MGCANPVQSPAEVTSVCVFLAGWSQAFMRAVQIGAALKCQATAKNDNKYIV